MKRCPHFEIWCKRIPRRASSPEGAGSFHEIKVPYCTHSQSPVPLEMAQQGLGEGAVLRCQGFVRRCPLPEGVRPEPEPAVQSEQAISRVEEVWQARANRSTGE